MDSIDSTGLPGLIGCGFGLVALLAVFAVFLAIGAFICYILYKAADRLPPQYRQLVPASVFLLLVPIVNFFWIFFVVTKLSRSYQQYFAAQGRTDVGDAGFNVGLGWAVTMVGALVPVVGMLSSLASLVLMIMYLVKMTQLRDQVGPDLPPPTYTPPPIPPVPPVS